MRKLSLPLLSILLVFVTACQKEVSTDKVSEEIAGAAAAKQPKFTVCHYDAATGTSKTILVTQNALAGHLSHGDLEGDCSAGLSIGDPYQGGIIAYLDATGLHGLIAAPGDQGTAPWGCYETEIDGADGTAIGTGNQNTIDIMNGCATAGIAARICGDLVLNGYDDWYLPSKDELHQLYINKAAIGGFTDPEFEYWSSSEYDAYTAWLQEFGPTLLQLPIYKFIAGSYWVRAVRTF